ncbi:hypothetical protein [Aeromonas finlandensis]|uniref:hypothetical protein n=1 Tax=Aeromonas finlandensis TaxID=1543375 RepID=UPI00051C0313|nr:hypothetical protein [Aeromonas finlandensis]
MSPLRLIDDLLDLIDLITHFPRYWRLWVGVVCTASACMTIAKFVDSPEQWQPLYWLIGIVGVGLAFYWQHASR